MKHRRIYYIPGIITLIFAPIIFLIRTNHYLNERKEYCIQLIYKWNDEKDEDCFAKTPAKRNYYLIELNERREDDSLKFLFVENFARAIELSHDTVNGIKIVFKKNVKYGEFIKSINVCIKSKISNYVPYHDSLFLYYEKRGVKECDDLNANFPNFDLEKCGFCDEVIIDTPHKKPSLVERIKSVKDQIILGIPFLLVYIILVVLSIKRLIRINNGG